MESNLNIEKLIKKIEYLQKENDRLQKENLEFKVKGYKSEGYTIL